MTTITLIVEGFGGRSIGVMTLQPSEDASGQQIEVLSAPEIIGSRETIFSTLERIGALGVETLKAQQEGRAS